MNLLKEIFLTVCFAPALLLALAFVPLFAYSPLILSLLSVLLSVFITALGLIILSLSSGEQTKAPRDIVWRSWVARLPLLAYFLYLAVRFLQAAYQLTL